ncbi:MAG TPA: zf-HC2 domain-containing protein [Blastocatellia bacterium]|nr:zf-HC2 domain-containing protein [Blastocatellia bacterium]
MDHSYIEEHQIIDRYLLGQLSDQERMRFEAHFENCGQCIDRMELIADLRLGLQMVAAEELPRARAFTQTGRPARIARLGRARQAALLVGVTLLIILPAGALIQKWRSLRQDLAQATQTATEWQRRYEEREQAGRDPIIVSQSGVAPSSPAGDRPATAPPESERIDGSQPTSAVREPGPSPPTVPVFTLNTQRSVSPDLSQPVNRLVISPSSSKLIILLLGLETETDIQSYRAVISTADGRRIWRKSQLRPVSSNALALSLDSALFTPGNYLLTLEGVTVPQHYVLIARDTFRVVNQ